MKFYRENNINPAASCLPLLAQFPVFIALYFDAQALLERTSPGSLAATSSRTSPTRATSHWSGYVLLAIYAGSPGRLDLLHGRDDGQDAAQHHDGRCRCVFITVVARFPTGLVLYWMTTNLWTVGQGLVTRRLVPKHAGAERVARRPARSAARATPPTADGGRERRGAPPSRARRSRAAPQPRRVKRKKGGARR